MSGWPENPVFKDELNGFEEIPQTPFDADAESFDWNTVVAETISEMPEGPQPENVKALGRLNLAETQESDEGNLDKNDNETFEQE